MRCYQKTPSMVAMAMFVACCNGCDNRVSPPQSHDYPDVTITITAPADGASLTFTNDVNPATSGIQIDISAEVGGLESGDMAYLSNSAKPDVPSIGVPVLDGRAIFASYSLETGLNRITVTAKNMGDKEGSATISVVVDTVPAAIASVLFNSNSTTNDPVGSLRFSASEGAPNGGLTELTTPVTVTVSDTQSGVPVRVYSDNPVAESLVGQGVLAANLEATFPLVLLSGPHQLTIVAYDESGNRSIPTTVTCAVDLRPGTISVAAPTETPYTSASGVVDKRATDTTTDDLLTIGVQVHVSDNSSLQGARVTLYRNQGESDAHLATETIAADVTSEVLTFQFPLHQGESLMDTANRLRAELVDAYGNPSNSGADVQYKVDYLGPQLALQAQTAAGGPLSCTSGGPCIVDKRDPMDTAGGRLKAHAYLDHDGSDPYSDAVTTSGTNLSAQVSGCPCTVSLQSRIAGSASERALVLNSTFVSDAGHNGLYTTFPTAVPTIGPGFLPGGVRETVLHGVDEYGNQTDSTPLYLQIDHSEEALVSLERRDPQSGERLAVYIDDGSGFGPADDTGNAPVQSPRRLAANLGIEVDGFGVIDLTGAIAHLTVVADGMSDVYDVALDGFGYAEFNDVLLLATINVANKNLNTISVTITRDATTIGYLLLENLVADIDGPTYYWLREGTAARGGLREYAVPYDAIGVTGAAHWNAALDFSVGDQDPATGMNTHTTPLTLIVEDVEPNQAVVLETDRTDFPLSGNHETTTNCNAAGTCEVLFDTLTIPSLSNNQAHALNVTITDKAGNTSAVLATQTIVAYVDTVAPAAVSPAVCIGESNKPYGDETTVDTRYLESNDCTAVCTAANCNRREGKVTLTFTAPYEDATQGGRVDHYRVGYRALVHRDGIPDLTTCDTLTGNLDALSDRLDFIDSFTSTVNPGQRVNHLLSNVDMGWDYCIAIQAVDDLGNQSALGSAVARRYIPLRSWPRQGPRSNDWSLADNRDSQRAFFPFDPSVHPDGLTNGPGQGFGMTVANLGDMDGDGQDDLAIGNYEHSSGSGRVHLFFSMHNSLTPTAERPADLVLQMNDAASGAGFGMYIANTSNSRPHFSANALNNDLYADLVISAPFYNSALWDGAVFVYFGWPGEGVHAVTETNTNLPNYRADTVFMMPGHGREVGAPVITSDATGDHRADLIIGAPFAGKVYIYAGGATFPTGTVDMDVSLPTITISHSAPATTWFPQDMAAGDFNGDTDMDLAIVAYESTRKVVYIFNGPLSGNKTEANANQTITMPAGIPSFYDFAYYVGTIPAPIGGQPYDWLTTTAANFSISRSDVAVFKGSASGLLSTGLVANHFALSGVQIDNFGKRVVAMNDYDNDTYAEVAIAGNARVNIYRIEPDESTFGYTFTLESELYGKSSPTIPFRAFSLGVENVGTFLDAAMPDTLLVSDGMKSGGQLYLFW